MSKRSQWCEFDKETRKYIKKRDNNECIICHSKGALQIMHIFINRSHGGKGCKENGVLGCTRCHKILDNPIGKKENKLSQEYKAKCMQYLFNTEHIIYNDEFIKSLKFDKQKYLRENNFDIEKIQIEKCNYCKDCIMIVKRKSYNNTIPSYYCKYRKININKTTKVCNKFIRK